MQTYASDLWEITLQVSLAEAERVTESLAAMLLASSCDSLSERPVIEPSPEAPIKLTLWISKQPDAEWVSAHVQPLLDSPANYAITQSLDQDWVSLVQANFKPFQAGDFYVHPTHLSADDAAYPIAIDAGPAFGTGQHATTFGCLELISALAPFKGEVLDLGTGSGILAIAVAKRFGVHVIASDIEARAVATALANSKLNNVESKLTTLHASGFNHSSITSAAPFALITANILAAPLKTYAEPICAALQPGGKVILSGILEEQIEDVLATYLPLGFTLLREMRREGWGCLLLEKFV